MRDLTKGNIIKVMFFFSLPILLGNVFQQAYNLADIIIVGKKLGDMSLSAVGSTASVVSLLFNIINGLCTGFAIPVSRHYGSGDQDKMRKNIAGMITFSGVTTAILIVICTIFLNPLLTAINTPKEIFDEAGRYLSIVVFGLVVTTIYNLEANMLRAVGNSVVPLIILIISALLNVGLDLLFLYVFEMGVEGAALATVIAQFVSASICFVYLIKKCPFLRPVLSDFRFQGGIIKPLLGAGLGMALMYSIVDIGSIVLQNGVNGFGPEIITAHTAARKLFGFSIMPFSAISATLVTFVSQNYGACKFDRIKTGIKYGIMIEWIWSTAAVIVVYLLSDKLPLLIVSGENSFITGTVAEYLRINVPFYYALAVLLSLRCSLQGLGNSVFPIVASIIEMLWKIITVVFVIPSYGYFGVCISEPIIWVTSGILVTIITIKMLKKVC
ncbi:MAG: MATE family efflux transporter [Ruminiclostridium sp.]|nr:MATE family efflux transporter [Ruminiclostridium sp.]